MRQSYALHLSGLFCGILVCALMLSGKIVEIGGVLFPASVILFPATFLISDALTEVYGFHVARGVIWAGLAVELVWIAAYHVAAALPPAASWHGQEAFVATLGLTPRIAVAGMAAYFASELLSALVMARLKRNMDGRWLPLRLVVSTSIGAGVDTLVVVAIAFGGVYPPQDLLRMGLSVWGLKVAWEALALPLSVPAIGWLSRREVAVPAPSCSARHGIRPGEAGHWPVPGARQERLQQSRRPPATLR